MAIVGVSGSPIVDGNTDRMVQAILEKSGKEYEFVNLSTLRFDPCRACAHLCAESNMCGRHDELHPYLALVRDAEALVLGTPVHLGAMTAWMFSFLSRLWCLHHVNDLLQSKPVQLVVTALVPETAEEAAHKFADHLEFTNALVLGSLVYASRTPPCYKCGLGSTCKVGGLWMLLDQDEEKLRDWKPTPDMFHQWEDCPEAVAGVDACAARLKTL